jgi:hypothetical protein
MQFSNMIRYGIWCGIAQTANANRQQYRMTTTWLPHLLMNSVTLLLPEIYRGLRALSGVDFFTGSQWNAVGRIGRGCRSSAAFPALGRAADAQKRVPTTTCLHLRGLRACQPRPANPAPTATGRHPVQATLETMVCDNPRYAAYVAPLAAGYLTSHPRFNIYKGAWAEKEFAGLGLDALPHIATAFALTALVRDTAGVAARTTAGTRRLERLLRWSGRHRVAVSAVVLALVTLGWEAGEYHIYRHELAQRGDRAAINMQWSRRDMLQDCAANAIGWVLAILWK